VSKVEWPLALPLVISGLRSATLQVVATATVAAYSSGEGLGRLLITGNATRNYSEMFAGAFMVAALAIVLDILLGGLAGWPAVMPVQGGHAVRVEPPERRDDRPASVIPS
jgi:osmoprotectant transport system permease protein